MKVGQMQPPRRWTVIVGLVFAMGWPLLLAAITHDANLHDVRQDGIVLAAEWIWLLVVYGIVAGLERRPFFSTAGWRAPERSDWIMIAFFALIAAGMCALLAKQHPAMAVRGTILAQVYGVPLAMRAALVFTAGVCEETVFRGYGIGRLMLLTGNVWLGALITLLFFTLPHASRYGFSTGLLGVAAIGALLTAIYIWRRNIWPCIVLHWLIDGTSLLILPAFVTPR